jgi:hypothetical protein
MGTRWCAPQVVIQENKVFTMKIGAGKLQLPENRMHTTSYG